MIKTAFKVVVLLSLIITQSSFLVSIKDTTQAIETTKPNHSLFNEILSTYVSETGKVNYKDLKKDKKKLEAYLKELDTKPVQADWTKEEKLAYWINAYNAHTLQLIISKYPLKSILDLDGGKTWDVKRITMGGQKYSLNQIENDIIRPQFKDARIHFAVNCAAKSCPPLANEAFTAENLDTLLDKRTRLFINSTANTINANTLKLSKIFEWYAKDFGNVAVFIGKYSNKAVAKNAKITYNDYDWKLNE